MAWESGKGKSLIGTVPGTLFVEEHGYGQGQDHGLGRIRHPPRQCAMAYRSRKASRYCIKDAGLYRAMLRSHTRLEKAARRQGIELAIGREAGRSGSRRSGLLCHRTHQSDPRGRSVRDRRRAEPATAKPPPSRLRSASLCTSMPSGGFRSAANCRKDGHLLAAYYFRDIDLNPKFADDTFTRGDQESRCGGEEIGEQCSTHPCHSGSQDGHFPPPLRVAILVLIQTKPRVPIPYAQTGTLGALHLSPRKKGD